MHDIYSKLKASPKTENLPVYGIALGKTYGSKSEETFNRSELTYLQANQTLSPMAYWILLSILEISILIRKWQMNFTNETINTNVVIIM